mmetsp:Transcript_5359/g.15169  ORF Transcript_5359/g.15169 Transcript_5359/m.15169 type:complete len:226 (-) Transcript_5359:352-1029(-)
MGLRHELGMRALQCLQLLGLPVGGCVEHVLQDIHAVCHAAAHVALQPAHQLPEPSEARRELLLQLPHAAVEVREELRQPEHAAELPLEKIQAALEGEARALRDACRVAGDRLEALLEHRGGVAQVLVGLHRADFDRPQALVHPGHLLVEPPAAPAEQLLHRAAALVQEAHALLGGVDSSSLHARAGAACAESLPGGISGGVSLTAAAGSRLTTSSLSLSLMEIQP